jgi:hypothetical protein
MTMNAKDILLGRGGFCYRNAGNVAFRDMIKEQVDNYSSHANRSVKGKIIQSLITQAQEQGRLFLVRSLHDDSWREAHPKLVRSKVSHALRDARNSSKNHRSVKKTRIISDSVNDHMGKRAVSLRTHDCSIKQDIPMEKVRVMFPLDMTTAREVEKMNNDVKGMMDCHNVKSFDEYEFNAHGSVSKTNLRPFHFPVLRPRICPIQSPHEMFIYAIHLLDFLRRGHELFCE